MQEGDLVENNLQKFVPSKQPNDSSNVNGDYENVKQKTSFQISCEILKAINYGYTSPSEIVTQNIPSANLKLRLEKLISFGRIREVNKDSSLHYTITPEGKALLSRYEELEKILHRIEKKRRILQSLIRKRL